MTADTSAVIAALSTWHKQHDAAARALQTVTALPAHVMLEAYSVLTRLPSGLAVAVRTAADVLCHRFEDPPLAMPDATRGGLLKTLAEAGVFAGASYDGLIALEAHAHQRVLLSLDHRAQETYRRLRVPFRAL
ncbi:MAG: PIN domain-containing protein [Solirubrobacteraceae bacterium]